MDVVQRRVHEHLPVAQRVSYVETIIHTLLLHVLQNMKTYRDFIILVVEYVYNMFIRSEMLRSRELDERFRHYVTQEFERRFREKLGITPDFSMGDVFEKCVEFLTREENLLKLAGTRERARDQKFREELRFICYDIVFVATVATLRDLGLID